ncbi:hypothetical protein ACFOYW_09165 [Gryllotalpicola reticulitermitis]|uniref:RHS repeat-associated core domain-containing protein n=1 Tax=Gryllotalpicola reticulitermitis TaxID=1184153 RepID=A0ABV8Q7A7_9MICO
MSTDPVYGNANPYIYPADPITGLDLTGKWICDCGPGEEWGAEDRGEGDFGGDGNGRYGEREFRGKIVKGNSRANEEAREHGFEGAEDFTEEHLGALRAVSRYDMGYDDDGRIWVVRKGTHWGDGTQYFRRVF